MRTAAEVDGSQNRKAQRVHNGCTLCSTKLVNVSQSGNQQRFSVRVMMLGEMRTHKMLNASLCKL